MILAARRFNNGAVSGLQFLLQKNWRSPVEENPRRCFGIFDEVSYRQEHDREATRPYLSTSGSAALSDLRTSTETSLRRAPRALREGMCLWTAARCRREPKHLWIHLPVWAHACLEKEDASSELLQMDPLQTWQRLDLSGKDLFLHVRLFAAWEEAPLPSRWSGYQAPDSFYRVANLVEMAQDPLLAPVFSFALGPAT